MSGTNTLPDEAVEKHGKRRIGDVLVESGVIDAAALERALAAQDGSDKRVGEVLVELGEIAERDVAQAVASQREIPFVDLRNESPVDEIAQKLSEDIARKFQALPLRMDGSAMVVAFADPTQEAIMAVSEGTREKVLPYVAAFTEVRRAIDNTYRATSALDSQIAIFEESDAVKNLSAAVNALDDASDDAPVVRVVNMIATQAMRDRASDIHIEPMDTALRVRFRIDGALQEAASMPVSMGPALISRLKVMANMNIVEKRRPQDGQITLEIEGNKVDVRVATSTTIWGEKAVLRILDKRRALHSLNDLGMSKPTHKIVSQMVRQPFGMVICAGPTGSGKTTTLYAALAEINRPERNITTIEDPVEYVVPSINQIQINEQAGVTFAGGLKAILRQDPDVILVGEIRDVETARIAVQSALTGHFVLSSLHATNAVSALQRFVDMGIETFLIASSVNAVIGQRLLRRICSSCKTSYEISAEELATFHRLGGDPDKKTFFYGAGCNFCAQTGYQDRIGVYEVLTLTDEMRAALINGASTEQLRDLALEQGMKTMVHEAIRLVSEDLTTVDEVIRTVYVA